MGNLPLSTTIKSLPWIPNPKKGALARLGIRTLSDLLHHFPRRYEDRTNFHKIPTNDSETPVCLYGIVTKTAIRSYSGYPPCFEAEMEPVDANLFSTRWTCRWFNARYLSKFIKINDQMIVYGKVRVRKGKVIIDHPEYELIESPETSLHFGRITPIYPSSEGLNSKLLRQWIAKALEEFNANELLDLLPEHEHGISKLDAIHAIHFPENWEILKTAREYLVLEEFFLIQSLLFHRRQKALSKPAAPKKPNYKLLFQFLKNLPFKLTQGQKIVLDELLADMAKPTPMRRLLQGDVGSGKTVIAAACAVVAVEAGWQVALMAPTQILANQHYKNFQKWLSPLGIAVSLVTSESKTPLEDMPLFRCPKGGDVLIGTHALLYESAPLPNLGLVIIDEQHKFGVEQRARLLNRGDAPDLLVMTATPIPRTLTQTIHGDLEVSFLRERPALRAEIQTFVRPKSEIAEIIHFLKKEILSGYQAYIVCPLIEESEKIDAASVLERFNYWQESLSPHPIGLLHGKMSSDEKEKIMQQFYEKKLAALVCTTVVEVGLDVPNATVILIENAERFGLAQLHQLRGRVGRGSIPSTCILLHGNTSPEIQKRLSVLEKTNDGFKIAEADWILRGPGDLLGTSQVGLPALKVGNLLQDAKLMDKARKIAQSLFISDPTLSNKPKLKKVILEIEESYNKNASDT